MNILNERKSKNVRVAEVKKARLQIDDRLLEKATNLVTAILISSVGPLLHYIPISSTF